MKQITKWAVRAVAGVAVIAGGFLALGILAPLKIHHTVARDTPAIAPYGPDLQDRPFVGLALSGGGTRAALFGAAGMQALAERGLLDEVTHVSSVSGGGFPASYMATHAVPDCAYVSDPSDSELACLRAYFADMQTAISPNYMRAIHIAQITTPWRIVQPSRRLSSLSEILSEPEFLDSATFADITDPRGYFFNAVSYDTGQRFVFSNLAMPHYLSEGANILPPSLRSLSFSELGAVQPTPGTFEVSLAVATSAAFPPYLGPLSIEREQGADDPSLFRRLGDGGILENSGVETLTEVFLGRGDHASALIYSFDAGLPLDAATSQRNRDLSIFSINLPQFVDVLLTYATAHREAHITQLAAARGIDINVISFDYLDVAGIVAGLNAEATALSEQQEGTVEHLGQYWQSWATWEACTEAGDTPLERLRAIPTSLSITACDASLVTQAAEFVVEMCLEAPAQTGCFAGR